MTDGSRWKVGLHQGIGSEPKVMNKLTDKIRQVSLWTVVFLEDIVICSEGRERRRYTLERRGKKAGGSKTDYMCVNERKESGMARM